ncbi:PAS domain-containing protein [Thalassobaculum litoreum]|uniref:PAS domain-containing protein n=1 Tax=Thalassobaculum litoreum DSM 18839 TaxID=1123362 RepID=A0A8G2BES7_9PROT|nr:PAS domain-containing protein [Thalassobaculum litoreum]SDF24933.1 PAS domain-containing protein [Thalassobaculum litoreum DSM 18839]
MTDLGLNPTLQTFADHWAALPKTGLVPHRRDFHPERLGRALAHMVVHELISPTDIRLRIVGTVIGRAYDEEITGRNYLDMVPADRRKAAARPFFAACATPCGMYTRMRSVAWRGLTMERVSLGFPVRDDTGVRWFYSCSTTEPSQEPDFDFGNDGVATVTEVLDRRFLDIGAGIPD